MATKIKPTVITVEQAEELEAHIGDYFSGDGVALAMRNARALMRNAKVPARITSVIFERMESLGQDLARLRDGDIERWVIEGLSDDLKRFDEFLGRAFKVTGMKKNRKYVWEVWG